MAAPTTELQQSTLVEIIFRSAAAAADQFFSDSEESHSRNTMSHLGGLLYPPQPCGWRNPFHDQPRRTQAILVALCDFVHIRLES